MTYHFLTVFLPLNISFETLKMSAACPVNSFNKSKEDFIWFVKKAVTVKKSYSHSEMYHSLRSCSWMLTPTGMDW